MAIVEMGCGSLGPTYTYTWKPQSFVISKSAKPALLLKEGSEILCLFLILTPYVSDPRYS